MWEKIPSLKINTCATGLKHPFLAASRFGQGNIREQNNKWIVKNISNSYTFGPGNALFVRRGPLRGRLFRHIVDNPESDHNILKRQTKQRFPLFLPFGHIHSILPQSYNTERNICATRALRRPPQKIFPRPQLNGLRGGPAAHFPLDHSRKPCYNEAGNKGAADARQDNKLRERITLCLLRNKISMRQPRA